MSSSITSSRSSDEVDHRRDDAFEEEDVDDEEEEEEEEDDDHDDHDGKQAAVDIIDVDQDDDDESNDDDTTEPSKSSARKSSPRRSTAATAASRRRPNASKNKLIWVVMGKTDHEAYCIEEDPTHNRILVEWVTTKRQQWISLNKHDIKTELPSKRRVVREQKPFRYIDTFQDDEDDSVYKTRPSKKPKKSNRSIPSTKKQPIKKQNNDIAFDADDFVGQRVAKYFGVKGGEILFTGTIVSTEQVVIDEHDDIDGASVKQVWRVHYDDDDSEDLGLPEVQQAMALYQQEIVQKGKKEQEQVPSSRYNIPTTITRKRGLTSSRHLPKRGNKTPAVKTPDKQTTAKSVTTANTQNENDNQDDDDVDDDDDDDDQGVTTSATTSTKNGKGVTPSPKRRPNATTTTPTTSPATVATGIMMEPKVFSTNAAFPYKDARVAKHFDGTLYYGRITSCRLDETRSVLVKRDASCKKPNELLPVWLWHVKYTDGDKEDLDLQELHQGLELYRSRRCPTAMSNKNNIIEKDIANTTKNSTNGAPPGEQDDHNNNDKNDDGGIDTDRGKYWQVDQVVDRRYKKMAGGIEAVQYLVQWKGSNQNSWVYAEQLDPNSLAEAWRKFPPPKRPSATTTDHHEQDDDQQDVAITGVMENKSSSSTNDDESKRMASTYVAETEPSVANDNAVEPANNDIMSLSSSNPACTNDEAASNHRCTHEPTTTTTTTTETTATTTTTVRTTDEVEIVSEDTSATSTSTEDNHESTSINNGITDNHTNRQDIVSTTETTVDILEVLEQEEAMIINTTTQEETLDNENAEDSAFTEMMLASTNTEDVVSHDKAAVNETMKDIAETSTPAIVAGTDSDNDKEIDDSGETRASTAATTGSICDSSQDVKNQNKMMHTDDENRFTDSAKMVPSGDETKGTNKPSVTATTTSATAATASTTTSDDQSVATIADLATKKAPAQNEKQSKKSSTENFDMDIDSDDDGMDTNESDLVDMLGDADYDGTGSAEIRINRNTYRLGNFCWIDDQSFVRITKLLPKKEMAVCERFLTSECTFLQGLHPQIPKGSYVQVGKKEEMPLSKLPGSGESKKPGPTCDWLYDCDPTKSLSSFCYYKNKGKIPPATPGKSRPSVLELFAGAGGMCLGIRNAGMETRWIVESNESAAATLKANFTGKYAPEIFTEDIRDFLAEVKKGNKAYPAKGEVDHIHASPPCQGFSLANRVGGHSADANNDLTHEFINAMREYEPATATYENVPGILHEKNRHHLQKVVAELLSMNYQVRVEILTASDFGDPQNRRRVILWAARCDMILPSSPVATHGDNFLPKRTVRDTIGALESYPVFADKKGSVKYPNGLVDHNCRAASSVPDPDFHVLRAKQPARTITGFPTVHYTGTRFLTIRESACLQSFPWDYQFFGSVQEQYKQVGNAVPVMLATAVARCVAKVHGLP